MTFTITRSKKRDSGMNLFVVVTVVFIILKMVGVVSWSWWIVFSPLLLGIALSTLVFIFGAFMMLLFLAFGGFKKMEPTLNLKRQMRTSQMPRNRNFPTYSKR